MTYTQAKIDAYAQLETAIENIRTVYFTEDGEDPNVLTGWVLLTSSIEFSEPDPSDPNQDDADTRSCGGFYSRRGQDPTLSYGILNEGLRHYNHIQMQGE